jgi:UDP-3-O-[3-hydroxymyristoyl] glucosamine N-acyltransferase LpxD
MSESLGGRSSEKETASVHSASQPRGLVLREIVDWIQARIVNRVGHEAGREEESASTVIFRPASLGASSSGDLAFLFSKSYVNELATANPSALLVSEPFVPHLKDRWPGWTRIPVIVAVDPYLAMAKVSQLFAPILQPNECTWNQDLREFYQKKVALGFPLASAALLSAGFGGTSVQGPRIHGTALVDPSARIGAGVVIGAGTVVDAHATIGDRTQVGSGCWIGSEAIIGSDCRIFSGVKIYPRVRVGERVRLHANSVFGADGFGYAPVKAADGVPTRHQKIYHFGSVVIGDDVEVGALSCIDRGTFADTRVDAGAKIDNQVHVGHNAHVGEGAILCGGICLAGNSRVGRFAVLGGMVGVTNEVKVGDFAEVGAMSLLTKDVQPRTQVIGNPQRGYREHFRAHAALNRLVKSKEPKGE